MELAFEFHLSAEAVEAFGVLRAAAGFECAGEVDERGDAGAEAEVFAVGADSEVA